MARQKNKIFPFFLIFIFLLPNFVFSNPWKEPHKKYNLSCGKAGGRLILATSSDPKSFNSVVAKETSTTQITGYFFEGLTRTDSLTLDVKPNLAKSWETDDGLTWIFNLREDVYFSDGEKFTADDVVFTFNDLIYNPAIPTSSRNIFTIEGQEIKVNKIDDYRVEFILPSVFAPFLRSLGTEILPEHKYKKLVESGKFNFSMGLNSKPVDIVGTGSFMLKKYLPGERIILEKNPYYWKKDACGNSLPYLEEIVFTIIPNAETILLKFLEGGLDYCSLRPSDLSILGPNQKKDNFSIYNVGVSSGSNFLVLNQNIQNSVANNKPIVNPQKLKLFRNKKFRKALSFALNRKKIITVVYNELAVPQYSCISPSNTLFFNDKIEKYPYDLSKANNLFKELGLKDRDEDGFLEDNEGTPVEISLFTVAGDPVRVKIATLIKQDLEKAGIKIHFLPIDFNNLVVKLTSNYAWEMILIGLTGGTEPHFGKNVWSYTGTLHAWNPTKKPIDDYEEKIEDIFNRGVKILDHNQRKALYDEWQYIVSDELPFIYTVLPYSLFAVRERFGNLYPTINGGAFSEIEHIYIKQPVTRDQK